MMLTSGGQRMDNRRSWELGITAYLTKPILEAELWEALLTRMATTAPASTPLPQLPQHPASEHGQSWHVVVAEDNVVNQKLFARLLLKWWHAVVRANSVTAQLL